MCDLFTPSPEDADHAARQILSSRDLLAQGEGAQAVPEHAQDASSIPMEARYFLMVFLWVTDWALACDILDAHPLLVAPWAANYLRAVLREVRFSARDIAAFSAHIYVLDLAQSLGVAQTRAMLTRRLA